MTEPRKLSVDANPLNSRAVALAQTLSTWLKARDAFALQPSETDVQVVLGGDGAVIRAARAAHDIPVVGIDFGHFGFLTQIPPAASERRLRQILAGDYGLQESPTLRVIITRAHNL